MTDGCAIATQLIHTGHACQLSLRTPGPAIQKGSTILLKSAEDIYDKSQTTYGRGGLATHDALRSALADLESAEEAFLFPTGLSAITGVLQALTGNGDEVLASDSVYGPTRRYLNGTARRYGVRTRYFAPQTPVSELAAMIGPQTKVIFLESPGSLTFDIQDVPAIAQMAREKGVMTVIDNTWSAGVLFKPLTQGVDVSIQAMTKYICGHSDVFMGLAACSGEARAKIAETYHEVGWAVSADDAYMALRGLRTLVPRLKQHGEAALKIANWLSVQPEVSMVLCPALPGAPGHEIWKRDFSGICGLFGLVLHPQPSEAVAAFLNRLKLFGLGYSWGGYESLAIHSDPQLSVRCHPAGFNGPLVRLHIGLEDANDLIGDLRHGLDALSATSGELDAAE